MYYYNSHPIIPTKKRMTVFYAGLLPPSESSQLFHLGTNVYEKETYTISVRVPSQHLKTEIVALPSLTTELDEESVSSKSIVSNRLIDELPLLLNNAIEFNVIDWKTVGVRYECIIDGDPIVPLLYRPLLKQPKENNKQNTDNTNNSTKSSTEKAAAEAEAIAAAAAAPTDVTSLSMHPAVIQIEMTLIGSYGYKPLILKYSKKCGGHKHGLLIWIPSSHMYQGNDKNKRLVMDAGRR
jgi:hypothetical protein